MSEGRYRLSGGGLVNEETYDEQEALMIDCDIKPCNPRHSDHGEMVLDTIPWMPERKTINGHPATRMKRTVIYSAWEPVE